MGGAAERADPAEEPGPDLRLAPIAAVAWVGCWIGTDGRPGWLGVGAALVVLLAAAAVVRRSVPVVAAMIMLCGALIIGVAHQQALARSAVARLADESAIATVRLELTDDVSVQPAQGNRSAYVITTGRVRHVTGRGQHWVERTPVLLIATGELAEAWRGLALGTELTATVRLVPADPGDDVAAVARAHSPPTGVDRPRLDLRMVEQVRDGLRSAVAGGTPQQRALVPSLVLGDTQFVTPTVKEEFRATGLTHLTAVSGANLAILLAFAMTIARWLGVRGWWLRLIGLLGVIVFVALCRTDPSVLRAAAMGLVALAALGMSGRATGLRSLFVAMIVLLIIDPWLGRSVGFALSVLASAGIVWWARRWAAVLQRWMPLIVAESITVPLAAHLITLPIAAALAGQVSMIGVLTNAVAGPFVAPATVLGFAAAGIAVLNQPVAGLIGQLACWCSQPILWTAHYGAALPGAAWNWPTTPIALALLGLGCLLLGVAMPVILRRSWLALLLSAAMIIAVLRAPVQPGWPPTDWSVVACDVGQGDGLVIRSGPRAAVVVDTGPEPEPMQRCLDQLRIDTVPLMILTHYHADHVGGVAGVFAGRRVARLWVSPLPSPAGQVRRVEELAARHRVRAAVPAVGRSETVGAVRLRVIGPVDRSRTVVPDADDDGESAEENDQSLSVVAEVDGLSVLLTGDIEPTQQQRLLASGTDLGVDVLKVAHHGSARQDADFVTATGARLALVSAGEDNSYGHPAPRTTRLLSSLRMTVLCTCRRGSIAVVDSNGSLSAVTQRAPS